MPQQKLLSVLNEGGTCKQTKNITQPEAMLHINGANHYSHVRVTLYTHTHTLFPQDFDQTVHSVFAVCQVTA